MFTYRFDVSVCAGLLTLALKSPACDGADNRDTPVIGTIGDHNVQQFVFERPGFVDYDLVLLFSGDGRRFPEQNLKKKDSFILTNALTQSYILTMQVQLRDGLEVIASSQYMKFAFRGAVTPGTDPIEPLPDPVGTITEKGVTHIEYGQNALHTFNQYGQLLESVSLPSDGGGADSERITALESSLGDLSVKVSNNTDDITVLQETVGTLNETLAARLAGEL